MPFLYAIVHVKFDGEKGKKIVVPTNWIEGSRHRTPGGRPPTCRLLANCFWPPIDQDLATLARDRKDVDKKTWTPYDVKFLRRFESYEEASSCLDLGIPFLEIRPITRLDESLAGNSNTTRLELISYFSRIADSRMEVAVRRIMKELMMCELGKYFQWGPHPTNSFSRYDFRTWNLKGIVIDAVKKTFPDANVQKIEYNIKIWLQNCLLNTR